jgi:hypothetical protein
MCIDHFLPKSKGGTDDDSNLFTCCAACNSAKAANKFTDLEQARRFIEFYKREYTRPWFDTNVVAENEASVSVLGLRGATNIWSTNNFVIKYLRKKWVGPSFQSGFHQYQQCQTTPRKYLWGRLLDARL